MQGNVAIHNRLLEQKKNKQKAFAVLIDPDKTDLASLPPLIALAQTSGVDYFFVGGSLMIAPHLEVLVQTIRKSCDIPVVLFPGSPAQITPAANALLYLSLISGRNPELLIGQHVISAPLVKRSGLEIIPTGYVLIDGGAPTTVSYISHSSPIPSNKNALAVCTAMAGEMLGLKLIYMDAGSGADNPVPVSMINAVAGNIEIPLIVGGGINDPEKAYQACCAGADLIVVGTAIEKDPELIRTIGLSVKKASQN